MTLRNGSGWSRLGRVRDANRVVARPGWRIPHITRRVIPHGGVLHPSRNVLQKAIKPNMKKFLFLAGVLTLLSTTGCIVADGGRGGHGRYERHDAVIIGPPAVVVRVPAVVVRPPEVIVR